jgi:hypothetical protein
MANRGRDKRYEVFGELLALHELAKAAGISQTLAFARVRAGWSPERIVTTPTRKTKAVDVGDVFGRLTVTAAAPIGSSEKPRWECVCACGKVGVIVREADVKAGLTTSCGCRKQEVTSAARIAEAEDLTGRVLAEDGGTVLGRSGNFRERRDGRRHFLWRCRCSCGREFEASGSSLRSGQIKHCGRSCLTRRALHTSKNQTRAERFPVHGETLTIAEMAERAGVTTAAIHYRLKHGMPPEKAIQPRTKRTM